jgi:hypothetical protein
MMCEIPVDPDGNPGIPLPPDLDLTKEGFGVVDQGVRELVRVLWKLGYETVCSCAGHEKELEPYPWVVIPINMVSGAKPLKKLAELVAKFNLTQGVNGQLPQAIKTWALIPMMGPAGFAIYLQPFENNAAHSPETISKLRKQADALAIFMEQESAKK